MFSICPPPPPRTDDNQLIETDYVAYGAGTSPFSGTSFTNDCSAYRDLFFAAPAIGAVLDYVSLPVAVRKAIWDEIDAAEGLGYVADFAPPADYPVDAQDVNETQVEVDVTAAEGGKILGAKVAHAMLHEIAGTFPWKIASYSYNMMRGVLDPNLIFHGLDPGGTNGGYQSNWNPSGTSSLYRLCDHSPNRMWAVVDSIWDNPVSPVTPRDAVLNLLGRVYPVVGTSNRLSSYRHSRGGTDAECIATIDDTIAQRDVNNFIFARLGCHQNSRIAVAYARAINIPAFRLFRYFSNTTHSNCMMPTARLVFNHGDDMLLTPNGASNVIDYDWYRANIIAPYAEGAFPWTRGTLNVQLDYLTTEATYRRNFAQMRAYGTATNVYPGYAALFTPPGGWAFLSGAIDTDTNNAISQGEKDGWKLTLQQLTGDSGA